MKAKAKERYRLGKPFHGPTHVLVLAPGRALALARYHRRAVLLEGGSAREIDLAPLARDAPEPGLDLAGRGAPFRVGAGFAVAYRDVLHLWSDPHGDPATLPVSDPDAPARAARGRIEPLLAGADGDRAAWLALQAGVSSIHSAHRVLRMSWDDRVARWEPGDLYLDERALGIADAGAPGTDLHPPALHAIAADGDGILVHSSGPSRNHRRYGMAYSILATLDRQGRVVRSRRVGDGYGSMAGERVLLEALHPKPGGLDFALLDRAGTQLDTLRLTKGAMGPVTNSWLVYDLWAGELWMADDTANVVCFALE